MTYHAQATPMLQSNTDARINWQDNWRSLQERLDTFDYTRWSIACREMQVRLMHGAIEPAHRVLDAFARFTGHTRATLASPLAAVLPPRIVNALEQAGYLTIASVDSELDQTLERCVANLGPATVATIRRTIEAVRRGDLPEQFADDYDLLEPACFIRRLEDLLLSPRPVSVDPTLEAIMSTNAADIVNAVSALSDPKTVEILKARIKEVEVELYKLREALKLLEKKTPKERKSKPLTDGEVTLTRRIAEALKLFGPQKPGEIAKRLGVAPIAVGKLLKRMDNVQSDGGVHSLK